MCNKSFRISLQLNDLLHTSQVHGHSPHRMRWCLHAILINTALTLETFALQTFTDKWFVKRVRWAHGSVYLHLCCCRFYFMDFHLTDSFHVKCTIGVLLSDWYPMVETSSCSEAFLEIYENLFHSAAQNLLYQYGMYLYVRKVTCCRRNFGVR